MALIGKAAQYLIYSGQDSAGETYFCTQDSTGGYYRLETLLKSKGLNMSDYTPLCPWPSTEKAARDLGFDVDSPSWDEARAFWTKGGM